MKHKAGSCMRRCSAIFLTLVMVLSLINLPAFSLETNAAAKKYTITYKLNGGKNSSKNPKKYTSSTKTIKLKKATKKGYTFGGWYTTSKYKKKVTKIAKGSKGNKTLYAKWTPNSYTVSFDGNGSTGGSTKKLSCKYGKSYKLTANGFKRQGYKFAGWNTKKAGTGKSYKDKVSVKNLTATKGATVKLYAQWKPMSYQIVFDANGGQGAMEAMDCYYGLLYSLPVNTFTKSGMVFKGWNTKADGSGVTYFDAVQFQNMTEKDGEVVTLYAQWMESGYIVSFNANGGSGTIEDMVCKFGKRYTLPTNVFECLGCEFTGWNTKPGGDGKSYGASEGIVDAAADGQTLTLYAQWKLKDIPDIPVSDGYTISYVANASDVTGTMSSATYKAGETVTFPACGYTRTGYVFYSWNTKASGTGKAYKANKTDKDIAGTENSIVLYAIWNAVQYKIAFDANGGNGTMSKLSCVYDKENRLTDNAYTKDGYEFAGWTTNADGSGQFYDDGQSIKNLTSQGGAEITLYAQWEKIVIPEEGADPITTYTIKFSANGSDVTGTMNPLTATLDQTAFFPACEYSRTGYKYNGWNTKAGGDGTPYPDRGSALNIGKAGGSVTLYAQWIPISYTIVYNANGGIGTMTNLSCTYDTAVNLTDNAYTRSGYRFIGWNTKADGSGVTYAQGSEIKNLTTTADETITLYAQWQAAETPVSTYTVKFNANGGSGNMLQMTCYSGASYILRVNTYTKEGYHFGGWNTKADGSGTAYADSATIKDLVTTSGGSIELYAQWKKEVTTYTIQFASNGGTGSMNSVTATNGVAFALPANTFTRTDYSFKEWNTKADGSGTAYKNKASVTDLGTAKSTVTLYAQWTANAVEAKTYTIKFNANGGTGSMSSVTATIGAAYTLPANTFTRSGYSFKEWNTKADGSGTVYKNKASVTDLGAANATVTLYAQWTANAVETKTYTIKFDSNGGSGTMTDMTCDYDKTYQIPANIFTREGYEFTGWNTKAGGAGTAYAVGTNVSKLVSEKGGSITLYAQWEKIVVPESTYVISYNANADGVSGTMSNQTVTCGSQIILSANEFTRTGYTFTGWNTSKTGVDGTPYLNKASVKDIAAAGATVTLYAQWSPVTYSIAFDAAGGTGTMTGMSCVYDTTYNLTKNVFTKSGYAFDGWRDASGNAYADGASVSNLSSTAGATVTLTAQWKEVSVSGGNYTIKFDGNGAAVTGTMANMTAQVGVSKALTACAYKNPGYTFDGWSTSASGTVDYEDKATVKNIAAEGTTITLYAHWTAIKYSIAFDANGGSSTPNTKSCTYGKSYNLPTGAGTYSGYKFSGWNSKKDGSGTVYSTGESVSNLTTTAGATVTLYAQWTKTDSKYTIVFNANGGSGTMSDITKSVSDSVTLPANTFTRANYTFGGWMLTKSGTAAVYADKATITEPTVTNGKMTLYAYWKPMTYKVHFNNKSATGNTSWEDTQTWNFGEKYKMPDAACSTGYKVASWNTKYNGSGDTAYMVGESYKDLASETGATVELYPQIEKITYKIYFRVNYSSVTEPSIPSATATYDEEIETFTLNLLTSRKDTVVKYLSQQGVTATFVGWNTKANGSGTWYYPGNPTSNLCAVDGGEVILYAQWK